MKTINSSQMLGAEVVYIVRRVFWMIGFKES